jgi:integrase
MAVPWCVAHWATVASSRPSQPGPPRIVPATAGPVFWPGSAWKIAPPIQRTAQANGSETAMRVSEVVSLERDDIDAAGLRFRVKAVNRKGVRGSRRARFVPVPAWLTEIVATSLPVSGRLFPELAADGLRASIRDSCANKGLVHCTPHRLRHRRISLWHFQGVPARELADRAGHLKPSMSLDVYSHVIVPDEVDPKMLGALLSGQVAAKRRARDTPVMHSPTP